jgi:protein SCO1/2
MLPIGLGISLLLACQPSLDPLPYIGDRTDISGHVIQHEISPFVFVSQLGDTIRNQDLRGKIYFADFFFTSCPSICPKVKKQMLRLYDRFGDHPDVLLVSHTIDPKRDSIHILKMYAENLEVDHSKWLFLTGVKEDLLDIADDYFVAAYEDPSVPGGFDHSGKILLMDKEGRIRSFCDGTDPDSVDRFMKDVDRLIKGYEQSATES